MDHATFSTELARNRLAYEKCQGEIRKAPAGRYAAIAQGRLITIADSFDGASAAVERLSPTPAHFLVFPVDEEPAFDLIDDFSQGI